VRWLWTLLTIATIGGILAIPAKAAAADFVVYSVYKSLDLGNPGETPQKDYYVNMGSQNGVREGMILDVLRKVPTYDLLTEKLYRDVVFPIAKLRVIHSESGAAIARLEKLNPVEKTPAMPTRAVMIGDLVRVAQ